MPLIYAGLSVCTFVAYWLDKRKAKAGRWRTPESSLQFIALLGGWPGALFAQHYLRHKSQMRAFLLVFYLGALLNLLALAWLQSQHMLPAGIGG